MEKVKIQIWHKFTGCCIKSFTDLIRIKGVVNTVEIGTVINNGAKSYKVDSISTIVSDEQVIIDYIIIPL